MLFAFIFANVIVVDCSVALLWFALLAAILFLVFSLSKEKMLIVGKSPAAVPRLTHPILNSSLLFLFLFLFLG